MLLGMAESLLGRFFLMYMSALSHRRWVRTGSHFKVEKKEETINVSSYETHEYDVLIIGAGGAGLRAAIEAAVGDLKVGLVCKSLLGKAHTVMAEGGVAAALANVDERDSWRVPLCRHHARRAVSL